MHKFGSSDSVKNRLLRCCQPNLAANYNYSRVQNEKQTNYVIVSDQQRKKYSWPNRTLGPLEALNPRCPLPYYVGIQLPKKPEPFVSGKNKYNNALSSLPVHKEDRYHTILAQTFSNIEFNLSEKQSIPRDVPENLLVNTVDYEIKAHCCPYLLKYDLNQHFVDSDLMKMDLNVICYSVKTEYSIEEYSMEMEKERKTLADDFISRAVEVCGALKDMGYWADFIDPRSGQPYLGSHLCSTESDPISTTHPTFSGLGFDIDELGCCRVIRHPVWGSRVFVGLIFSDVNRDSPVITGLTSS